MDTLLQDLRYAFRALRKARGMSVVAVVTLAVAIAALTTVFSVVNTGYFKPLPYPDPDRLVAVGASLPGHYTSWNGAPLEVVNTIRHDARSFERVAAYNGWTSFLLADDRGTVQLMATHVDTTLLSFLGAVTQRGRMFSTEEIASNAPVVLISDSLWRTRYGRDEGIVGRVVRLNDETRTVVGVLAPGFRFNNTSDLWVPLIERADTLPATKAEWPWLIAKLRPGVPLAQARRELDQVGRNIATGNPAEFRNLSLIVRSSMVERSNPAYLTMVAIFLAVTLIVFLIACTNVGNLLLVRAAERRAEMALRASLGASRARLIRQSLAESAILATVGGAVGALLSVWAVKLMLALFPTQGFPSWLRFGFDLRVFAFVAFATALALVSFGLVPAREGARVNLLNALKAGGDAVVVESAVMRGGRRGVVIQIALSLSLFVMAALFARSYFFLARIDHGYDVDRVVDAHVALNRTRYPDGASAERVVEELRARLANDPRIEAMALAGGFDKLRASGAPNAKDAQPAKGTGYGLYLYLPDHPETPADRELRPGGQRLVVTDSYFSVLGMHMVRGRSFGPTDVAGGPSVAIVSARIAEYFWKGADPIGKTFQLGPKGPVFTVVGVASDVRDPTTAGMRGTSTAAWPNVYFSARQATFWPELYLRPRANLGVVQGVMESALRQVEPAASLFQLRTIGAERGESRLLTQIFGGTVGGFAVCGALLAMMGVYGVIAYGVTQRTREIGLRIALGANPDQVVHLFMRQGFRFTAIGLAVGVLLALGLSMLVRVLIWGVSPFDPLTYAAATVVFGAVASLACWVPARRASRVQPLAALRSL